MEINLNDFVKVKLTVEGLEQLRNWYKEINIEQYYREPDVDENGYSEFQMWALMNYFGGQMYNGNNKQMFANNLIKFSRKA